MAAQPHDAANAAKTSPSLFWAREAEALTFNAAERRAQAPCRFLVSIILGVGASFILKERSLQMWLWLWAMVNVSAQILELVVLWRFRPNRPAPGPAWTAAGTASVALVSLAYASGSLLLWNLPGLLGPAAAVLILGGCLVNVMMLSRGSALAFAATGSPHALFMVLGPFVARSALAQDDLVWPFCLAEGVFIFGVAIVWRHLEQLRREEAEARALAETRRAEAEAATEAKTRYAAAVSHELRTPLTAILAAADTLARRAADPQDAEAAGMVGDAGRIMRRLLDDLLDLAKIEAGRMDVDAVAFSPRALVEQARRFWAAEAAGSDLRLELTGAEALPTAAMGDPQRLRQVLDNLISNAVKFTANGVITLSAAAEATAGGETRVTLSVADTGRGIPPKRLERLFTPFEQAHTPGESRMAGTGLGLAISRELSRLMGGDLVAQSSPQGSCFTLSVVVQAAAPGAAESVASPDPVEAPVETTGPVRLLVVDDQPLVRKAIGVLLDPLGFRTDYAEGGAEGLERLRLQSFDLVLMDVNMPDMDGRDATRRLRAVSGPNRHTPVIAVTGSADAPAVQTYLASGMNGVVAKPLEPKAFYAALDAALLSTGGSEALSTAA